MLALYGHPFSSYTWKALIPLYENDTPFEFRMLDPDHPENGAEFARRWPVGKFPLLADGDTQVMEASTIVEYLDAFHSGPVRFVPENAADAIEVRMLDRIFDNYVMANMQAAVNDSLLPAERRDPGTVAEANARLDTVYAWLDERMAAREWAAAGAFSLADCAGAPALFYADWVHPNAGRFPALARYRERLLARPSVARTVDEARPYRPLFPLDAPDRD